MKQANASLKILVADDHNLVRAGLVALLRQAPDLLVVAEAANGREAVELWRKHRPDVTLMDISMPEVDGIEATRRMRQLDPNCVVIALTTHDGEEDIFQAMSAGAQGYVPKDTEPVELFAAIRIAWSGKTYLPPDIAVKLMRRLSSEALTERELEIVQLIALGHGNKAIARQLSIAEGTVKTHVKGILNKLDATSRTEAVAIALRRGIARIT